MTTNTPRPSRPVRPIGHVRVGTPMLLGVVVALTLPVTAAYAAAGGFSGFHDKQQPGTVALSGPFASIEITGLNDDVHISGDPTARGITGTSLVEYRTAATEPQLVETVADGVAKLTWSCPGGHCDGGVSWHVTVPAGMSVTAVSTNGSVFLDSLTGSVTATTSNASIEARHLGSGKATFQTQNADIDAAFDGAPMLVHATTENADVDITTDGKTDAYDDVLNTNGDTRLSNPGREDRFASHTVWVRTTNGNITIS